MKVGVNFDFDLLSITNYFIASKHICFLGLLDNKNRSGNGAWMLLGYSGNIGLIKTKSSFTDIDDHVAASLFVRNNYRVAISEILVLASETPWNLFKRLLHLGEGFVESKAARSLLLVVVR